MYMYVNTAPLTQVRIGLKLNFSAGQLTYDVISATSIAPIIGGAVGGGVLLLLLLFCIIPLILLIIYSARQSKKKDQRFVNLLVQMESMELEMADQCKQGLYQFRIPYSSS